MTADFNRRAFLGGVAAVAVAPALPLPVLPETSPIYSGVVGEYQGVLIRSVDSLTLDHVRRAKAMLAANRSGLGRFHFIGRDGQVFVNLDRQNHWLDLAEVGNPVDESK